MNEPSEPDVEVFEHIRDTYAEFDPVPEDVLAAARGALGWGPPSLPFGWCIAVGTGAENLPRSRGCTQAQPRSAGSCRTAFSPRLQRWIRGFAPPYVIAAASPRSTADFTKPTGRVQLAAGSLAPIDAAIVVRRKPASRLRWCCLT
jgi:hypothetical protein